jgi:hypothetical protein
MQLRPDLLILLAVLMRHIIIADAFAFMSIATTETFNHVIKRPMVPYELGVRLIHTPESLLQLHPSPGMLSLFRFVGCDPPVQIGNYSSILFRVGKKAGRHYNDDEEEEACLEGRMLTNKRHESHLVIMRGVMPLCTLNFSVESDKTSGHSLRIQGHIYGQREEERDARLYVQMWRQQMLVVLAGLILESMCMFVVADERVAIGQTPGKYNKGDSIAMDELHLRAYRKTVLKLSKQKE